MADLSARREDGGCERGQLILVAAVGIAALLLTLSLLLNAAVFTENLATRGGHGEHAASAVDHRVAAEEAVTDLLARSNAEGWSYAEFYRNVSVWNERTARHAASDGATTSVTVSATESTRVVQTNASRTLTNATGAERWTVLTGVTGVEDWEMNLTRASLVAPAETTNASDLVEAGAFTVEFVDGGETWRLFVYRDGSGAVAVAVDDGTDPLSAACSAPADANDTVTVDVTAATVGGSSCPALESLLGFLGATGGYDVAFDHAGNATGTYELLVREPVSTVESDSFATDGTSPRLVPYLADVSIDVSYTTRGTRVRDDDVPIPEVTP